MCFTFKKKKKHSIKCFSSLGQFLAALDVTEVRIRMKSLNDATTFSTTGRKQNIEKTDRTEKTGVKIENFILFYFLLESKGSFYSDKFIHL